MVLEQQFDESMTLSVGALALHDVISVDSKIDAARLQGFRLVKSTFFIDAHGKTVQQGPVQLGVALNMSAGGVESAIESDPQDSKADNNRGDGTFIKPLAMMADAAISIGSNRLLQPIEVSYGKNGWSLIEGRSMIFWAYNLGDATLTTGLVVDVFAEHFGVWLRD